MVISVGSYKNLLFILIAIANTLISIVNEIRADVLRERLAAQRHIGIGQPCRTETVRQRGRFCIMPEQERHAHTSEQDQCAQHTENRVQDQITL